MVLNIHTRSYDTEGDLHSHDFVQVVLPLSGTLDIEVDGRGARLGGETCAFVTSGARHTQAGLRENASLVLETSPDLLPVEVFDDLAMRRFFRMSTAVAHLVDFARLSPAPLQGGSQDGAALARLLVSALGDSAPDPDPIADLRRVILRAPGDDWTPQRLAAHLGVSRSALYRLMAQEHATPQRFVTRTRLEAAQRAIRSGHAGLAEIAHATGFSDQSALTRAMRREWGVTPGGLRHGGETTPGQ